ncbi:MAG: alanyl-tRNA editing protein AlaXM [Candidatus Njordarchaeales archaeon]
MTELLYMDDSYLKEFEATVLEVSDKGVVLDKTAFYPEGGGLPSDTGFLILDGEKFRVIHVRKEGDRVYHILESGYEKFREGGKVKGVIDWERRYRIMRLHTAAHVLSGLFYSKLGALVTGNAIREDRAHIDFNVEKPDKALFQQIVNEANQLIKEGKKVKIYYMEREKALQTPGLIKLAKRLPPNIPTLRIVEIEGIDIQPDGGPHVANTREIGEIKLLKVENKGRGRRRIHFTVEP